MTYPDNKIVRFEASEEADKLYQRLVEVPEGATVKYDELGQIIGKSLMASFSPLYTARRRCLKNLNAVFKPVVGIGLRRLVPGAVVAKGADNLHRITRSAKRAIREISTTDGRKELTPEEERDKFIYRSRAVQIRRSTKVTTIKREIRQTEMVDGRFVMIEQAKKRAFKAPPTVEETTTTTTVETEETTIGLA